MRRTIPLTPARVTAATMGLLLLLAACGGGTPSDAGPSDVASVAQQVDDLAFSHPSTWQWSALDQPVPAEDGDVIGYLVTPGVEAAARCEARDAEACALSAEDIGAGSLAVELSSGSSLTADVWQDEPPADAEATTAGGMPALYRESTDGDDQVLSWTIARPESAGGWYRLDARLRGPGQDALRGELESVVGSISFEPPPVAPADDRVTLTQIAAAALADLRHDPQGRRQFECFDEQAGTRPGVVEQLPGRKPFAQPLAVACSLRAEATRWNQYRVRLRYAWPSLGDRAAGEYVVTQWVAPDGDAGPNPGGLRPALGVLAAQPAQEGPGIGTNGIDRVAALLQRHDRQACARDHPAQLAVVRGAQRQVANGVALEGVEAQRQHQRCVGRE